MMDWRARCKITGDQGGKPENDKKILKQFVMFHRRAPATSPLKEQ